MFIFVFDELTILPKDEILQKKKQKKTLTDCYILYIDTCMLVSAISTWTPGKSASVVY